MLRMFLSADPAKDGVVLAEQTEGQSLARGCGAESFRRVDSSA
jgi:hypothetical protein